MIAFARAVIRGRTAFDIRPYASMYFDHYDWGTWDYYVIRIGWLRILVSSPK